ncbi:MAG: hypothetical protein L0211_08715 [Planctomycetaceae bacterium]|nr:hypothetical protein [Planctomycetaceae bacterium]
MARQESDREDLLREATALVERAELKIPDEPETVTVGFRRDGSLSVFFGGQTVYQFNAAGQLRRAYADELLYKAERGRLVSLRRERTQSEVALVRRELPDVEAASFLTAAQNRLAQLSQSLERGQFQVLGKVPADSQVVDDARLWLQALPPSLAIAARPNV